MSLKRKRTLLDDKQKRDVINYSKENPKLTQQQIADNFTAKWDIPIKRRTVGDILSQKDFYESDCDSSPSRKRHRSGVHAEMEQCLNLWFANARAKNIPITDEILREKAKHFGNETGVTDFQYSNGWLQRFKSRHGIACHVQFPCFIDFILSLPVFMLPHFIAKLVILPQNHRNKRWRFNEGTLYV